MVDSPGDPVDKNPLARARDMGPIPGLRRFPRPKGNFRACEPQLLRLRAEPLKPVCLGFVLCAREATAESSQRTTTREEPLLAAARESPSTATKTRHRRRQTNAFVTTSLKY